MVVATYIEDQETSDLIGQYAELMHSTKTGALRDLLKREIAKVTRRSTAEERYNRLRSWLPLAATGAAEEIPKEYYDWLYSEGEAMPELSKGLKKRLGISRDGD